MEQLTGVQLLALGKLSDGEWHTAYSTQERISTLNALVRKGYAYKRVELGSMYCPRTGIRFKIKLNPCGNCEDWTQQEYLPLTDQEKELGFTRKLRCKTCQLTSLT